MKIKKETDYAIRFVDYLVRSSNLVDAANISEATDVPLRFTKNIMQNLAKKGIVSSYKGIHGGYKLNRPSEDISLYDVIEATQGQVFLNRCLCDNYECSHQPDKNCPYHNIFLQLSSELEDRLRGIRFSSVVYGAYASEYNITFNT